MLANSELIGFVPSTNLDRSRVFYEQTLGLQFVKQDPYAAVFRAAGRMLRVTALGPGAAFVAAPFTVAGWAVTDLRAIVTELTRRGVPFERYGFLSQDDAGIWQSPSGDAIAWFKDPDGNVLSLTQFS